MNKELQLLKREQELITAKIAIIEIEAKQAIQLEESKKECRALDRELNDKIEELNKQREEIKSSGMHYNEDHEKMAQVETEELELFKEAYNELHELVIKAGE